jgi:hypothetical protein
MDIKLLQQALNGAIKLDIENARENLKMDCQHHARALKVLSPNIAKFILALGNLNVDKIQAEMN